MRLDTLSVALTMSLVACGARIDASAGGGEPARAPTDAMEPLRTADGQVIGADGVPPEQKLAESPKVQVLPTPTVLPAAQPPSTEHPQGPDPRCADPKLDAATRKALCAAPAPH